MEVSNLSSNWKKLQATLQKTSKQEPAQNKAQHAALAKDLKRKADQALPASSTNGVKKSRSIHSTYSAPSTKKRRKMGAYFSTQAFSTNPSEPTPTTTTTQTSSESLAQPNPNAIAGKYIAIDCEMVGTHSTTAFAIRQRSNNTTSTATAPPEYSILARVSLVSYASEVLYDAYVLPPPNVTVCDYRTPYSGITAWHLSPGNPTTKPRPFEEVQQEVAALLTDRILVGHALSNDLAILGLSHPKRSVRDTARYPGYRTAITAAGGKSRAPSLKKLAQEILGWDIQMDAKKGHSSVEDARAAMALFKREKDGFEKEAARLYGRPGQMRGGNARQVLVRRGNSTVRFEEEGEGEEEDEDNVDDEEAERRRLKKKKKSKKR